MPIRPMLVVAPPGCGCSREASDRFPGLPRSNENLWSLARERWYNSSEYTFVMFHWMSAPDVYPPLFARGCVGSGQVTDTRVHLLPRAAHSTVQHGKQAAMYTCNLRGPAQKHMGKRSTLDPRATCSTRRCSTRTSRATYSYIHTPRSCNHVSAERSNIGVGFHLHLARDCE